ncbi:MAG: hypothetical protein ABI425_02085 [Patescibacteria group bacterium]
MKEETIQLNQEAALKVFFLELSELPESFNVDVVVNKILLFLDSTGLNMIDVLEYFTLGEPKDFRLTRGWEIFNHLAVSGDITRGVRQLLGGRHQQIQ